MLCLARSFRLQIVDVVVRQTNDTVTRIQSHSQHVNRTYSPVRCSVLDNFDMDDEVDLLETFCPHNDKVFISESWPREFTHIGQQFEGDAVEFRNVLRKYVVQCGFQFNYVKNDSVWITAIYLRWYNAAFMEHNPGSYVTLKHDEHTHRFTRYFISFKACIDEFTHCCPFLFLDATFLKGRFKGFLLVATAKDSNQDWNAGLLDVMPTVFPNAEHAFCLQYSQRNLRDKLHYTNSMHRVGLSCFSCRGSRYGEKCSNAAESFNSWIREARNLPITKLVDSIRAKIMRQMSKRRVAAQIWTGTICPKIESRLEKAFNKGC
ncbi:hypothetical protein ACSBR1_024865 [Camellia fascicularis]